MAPSCSQKVAPRMRCGSSSGSSSAACGGRHPARVEPALALHGQAQVRGAHVVLAGGDDEVAQRAEVRVDAVALVLAEVEADRPAPEVDGRRRPALRADHARRARARALAGGGGVDDDDAPGAVLAREDRRPAADRAGADDDEVRALAHRAASSRASARTAMAALRPLRAMTLPPGCVAAPQKYSPGTGVRGVRRCSHIWSGETSPWKMLPPVSPMRCSMSGGPGPRRPRCSRRSRARSGR